MLTNRSIVACVCLAAVALVPGTHAMNRDQLMNMVVSQHKMTKGTTHDDNPNVNITTTAAPNATIDDTPRIVITPAPTTTLLVPDHLEGETPEPTPKPTTTTPTLTTTTSEPTSTTTPAPTTTIAAPTTISIDHHEDTPAPTLASVAPTPCPFQVSVVGDATYCVDATPCGGVGTACPEANATAWGDCHSHLASYRGDRCVAPWNSTCDVIRSVGGVDLRGCTWVRVPNTQNNNEQTTGRASSAGTAAGGSAPLVYGMSGLALVLAVVAVAMATMKAPQADEVESVLTVNATAEEESKSQEEQDDEAAEADAKHLSHDDGAVVEV
ncbi:hypothetical protein H257_13845 [Aphanomyces astaci]|uniref:Uncharacterized protein n=1 Tax=Aphanomyces astaci TaxID=112090 RepID=W4FVT1_APHAT|nr:hypothetical protein H257_13845 [Aphanomyces astaci]ETV70758.1 hypothetical protein H257_13845 [Aphanomyces astaci]RQM19572.1 hypothetical protein B5M09_005489 [Aphanomyces astaci]|eukprot:XP_009839822.1 hypothetical protein H257_13845 [Aphanomyces astaci]